MNLSILIHHIKDKANVGSIFRLAHQFDASKIYVCNSAEPGKTNTYKIERRVPIINVDDVTFLQDLDDVITIGLETGGSLGTGDFFRNVVSKEKDILVAVGNESVGFTEYELKYFDFVWTLEAKSQVSFNVSHALAIALHRIFY